MPSTLYWDTNTTMLLEGNPFSLWQSTERAITQNSQTKVASITYNRSLATNVTVELNLSLVHSKVLNLSKAKRYSWLFSFQVVHLYEPPLVSVLGCSLLHSLPSSVFPQLILKGDAFQGCRVQHLGATGSVQSLGSPCMFPWLEADGGRALGQPVSRWHAQGVPSASVHSAGAKLSSVEPILPWHVEVCSGKCNLGRRESGHGWL